MYDMKIVGITTQQIVYAASQKRKFRINEILIIEDPEIGDIKAEVIETQSFNRFIPLANERTKMVDDSVLESLKQVGYSIDDQEIHLAKLRTISELIYPVRTGSNVRLPFFHEIEKMLVKTLDGWTMGVLRGTEEVAETMPDHYKNKGYTFHPDSGLQPFKGVPFIFPFKEMHQYPHVGIFGGSGSGKSHAVRVALEELQFHKIPGIVFDPHFEMEFKDPFSHIPVSEQYDFKKHYEVLTIGKEIGIPFEELTTNDVAKLLSSSSQNFTENMDTAVRILHGGNGETFQSFQEKLKIIIEVLNNLQQFNTKRKNLDQLPETERAEIEYKWNLYSHYEGKLNNVSVLMAVQRRLQRLESFGLFKHNIQPIVQGIKARKLVVIRGSIEHLQLFGSFLIRKLYESRRNFIDNKNQGLATDGWFPPFILAMDEAHNFAPKAFETPTKNILREISQEGRKYGVFLILASQRPALLDETIMAQLNTKFILRTVRGTDIKSLAEETDITQQDAARLPYLTSGEAFVSSAILGRTVFVRIRAALTTSPNPNNPFDELETYFDEQVLNDPAIEIILNELPFAVHKLSEILRKIETVKGLYSMSELKQLLKELEEQNIIKTEQTPFGDKYLPV